jgi:hypothetical protein
MCKRQDVVAGEAATAASVYQVGNFPHLIFQGGTMAAEARA